MGLEAGNPVFGGTVLRRAAIQSPNFAHKVAGWNIGQDGTAEFNSIVLRGEFDGTNFIVNSAGTFGYSGTPAFGNLLFSDASTSGTDGFGNAYLSGRTVYDPLAFIALQIGGAGTQRAISWNNAPSQAGPYVAVSSINLRTLSEIDWVLPSVGQLVIGTGAAATSARLEVQGVLAAKTLDVAPAATAPPPRPTGTEPWNYVGTAGQPAFGIGWSNFGGGFASLAFRFVAAPSRCVQIKGEVTHTAAAAQTIFTLPAAYQPVSDQQFTCITNASGIVGVEVSSAGLVELLIAPSAVVTHSVDLLVSLDI